MNKTRKTRKQSMSDKEWFYLMEDFLEMKSGLNPPARKSLLRNLHRLAAKPHAIRLHTAFSMNGQGVWISDAKPLKRCWIYYPEKGSLKELILARNP